MSNPRRRFWTGLPQVRKRTGVRANKRQHPRTHSVPELHGRYWNGERFAVPGRNQLDLFRSNGPSWNPWGTDINAR